MAKFGFNLIPQKPKELVVKEDTRDRVSVYSALLPLFGVILWVVVLIFNGLVVQQVKANWQEAVDDKKDRIAGEFLSTRLLHGEYVIKTRALADLIQKDIKPESLFLLTEALFPNSEFDQDVQILAYGRNVDGSFEVTLTTRSYEQFSEITRRFVNVAGTDSVKVVSAVLLEETGQIQGAINLFLDADQISDAQN